MELSVEKILNYIDKLPDEDHFTFPDKLYYQYVHLVKNPLFKNKEKAIQFVKKAVKNITFSQSTLQKFYDPFLEELILSSLEEKFARVLVYQVSYLINLEEIDKNKDFFEFLVNLFLEKDKGESFSKIELSFFNILVEKAKNKEEKEEISKWLKEAFYSLKKEKSEFLDALIFLSTLMRIDIENIEKEWINKKGFCPKNLWAKLFLLNVFDKEDVSLIGFLNGGTKQLNKLSEKDQMLTTLSILLLKDELKTLKKTGLTTMEKPSLESLVSLFSVLFSQKISERKVEQAFLFKTKDILSIDSLIKIKLLINIVPTIEKHIFYKEPFEAMSEINKIFEIVFNTDFTRFFMVIFYTFVSMQKVFDINKIISEKDSVQDRNLISLSKIIYETIVDIIKTEDSSRGVSAFHEEIRFFLDYFINRKNNKFKIPLIKGKVGKYEYKILTKDDTQGVLLGYQTNCCQYLGGAGDTCVRIGYYEPNSGFFTVNKKGKSYIQSWIYENTISAANNNQIEKLRVLVLDSVEIAAKEKKHVSNDLIESYKKAVKELSNHYDLILIGFSGQEGKEAKEKFVEAFQKIYLDNQEITEFVNENKKKIYPFKNGTYNDFVRSPNVIAHVSLKAKNIVNNKTDYVFKFEENFKYKKTEEIEDFFTIYKKIDLNNLFAEEIKNLLLKGFVITEEYQEKIGFLFNNFVIVKSTKDLFRNLFEKSTKSLTYTGEICKKISLEELLLKKAVIQERESDSFNTTNESEINNGFIATLVVNNENDWQVVNLEEDIPF